MYSMWCIPKRILYFIFYAIRAILLLCAHICVCVYICMYKPYTNIEGITLDKFNRNIYLTNNTPDCATPVHIC